MSGSRFPVVRAPVDGLLGGKEPGGWAALPDLDLAAVVGLAESAALRGRGGAGFPVARKLRAVAAEKGRLRMRRAPVVVVNAAEGEPASGKDAALLRHAPHAVLAGAALLARALGTRDVRVWAPGHDGAAVRTITTVAATMMARVPGRIEVTVLAAPDRFVAGESSAAARGLSGRDPLPRTDRTRTSKAGVDGRPTLVLNAETVAQLGRLATGGGVTRLVTVVGAVAEPGVVELPDLATVGQAVDAAGGLAESARTLVLGGYHGRWYGPDALELVLGAPGSPVADCSMVAVLPDHACLLAELETVARFLAGQSVGQCGPCAFGMPELARRVVRISRGDASDVGTVAASLLGRGACHHPDGSVGFVTSGLAALASEVEEHRLGTCRRPRRHVLPVPSAPERLAGGLTTVLPVGAR